MVEEELEEILYFPVTEWIGVFALGIITGLLAFSIKISNNVTAFVKRRKIILSIAVLSLSVGAIHLLLVQEHAKESYLWGIFFLISGIAQIAFGIIIAFVKNPKINNILYYIGINWKCITGTHIYFCPAIYSTFFSRRNAS